MLNDIYYILKEENGLIAYEIATRLTFDPSPAMYQEVREKLEILIEEGFVRKQKVGREDALGWKSYDGYFLTEEAE